MLNRILSKKQLEQLLDGEHFEPIKFEDEAMKQYLEIYRSQNWMLIGGKLLSKKLALWVTMHRPGNDTSLNVLYLNGMTAKAKVDLEIRENRYQEFTSVLKELMGYEGPLELYGKEEQLADVYKRQGNTRLKGRRSGHDDPHEGQDESKCPYNYAENRDHHPLPHDHQRQPYFLRFSVAAQQQCQAESEQI